jgi:hypothetical protein
MSTKLVECVSRLVDRNASRRGFLTSSAMGATAMAVAPATFALKPTSAYAAICSCAGSRCGCNSLCCDGYTDFCCLLTGENLCPPGTVVAGWWKADGSGLCDIDGARRPRYYLDCNKVCDPGCGCGGGGICNSECSGGPHCRCADGCNTRKVDCTRFRYGQCSQDVPCVGPITCRIITCVPPWLWDPACGGATATDNYTRWHDRPCLHEGFTDVSPVAHYRDPVEWMAERGITTGFSDDLFGPEESTTRAHIATFLWRYMGEPRAGGSSSFTDVPSWAYYAKAVTWMVDEEITTGTGGGKFSPDSLTTRAEAVTFLWRMAGRPSSASSNPFTDVAEGQWYADAVKWAAVSGITTGYSPTIFGPDLSLSRGEAATFLYRYDGLVGVALAP